MLINAEERIAYWGNRHMNVSCRNINEDDDPDLVGLERILYSTDFLAVTELVGVKPYDDAPDAAQLAKEDEYSENDDYEEVDSKLNPFEYEPAESDIQPAYPSFDEGVDPFAAISGSEAEDLGEFEIEDLGNSKPEPEKPKSDSPVSSLDELKKSKPDEAKKAA